jgi:hypothetical protein
MASPDTYGTRGFRHVKAHLHELQSRLDLTPGSLLIESDGHAYTGKEPKQKFRSACVHVEVTKRFENGKIVASKSRVVQSAPWRA